MLSSKNKSTVCSSQLLGLGLALLIFGGCKDNPGEWPQEKLQVKIMENLELTEAALSPKTGGGYEGTGKRADGENIKFTIEQDPAGSRFTWDATGDRGFIEDGYYELK